MRRIVTDEKPVKPTEKRIKNCKLFGWDYDPEENFFHRTRRLTGELELGYFTKSGFLKV